jgi:hypothetical protein
VGLASCGGGLDAEAQSRGDAAYGQDAGVGGDAMRDNEHQLDDVEHITRTQELLTYAARRAQERPAYVAWALARVQARERLSDEALAAQLGITSVDLPRLALCRRPRPDQWDTDLAQIAARFGLAPAPLATLLRAVDAPGGSRHDPIS